MARPKTPNRAQIQDAIIERMIEGESLRSICRDPDMPSASTIFRWLDEEGDEAKAFREQYARATHARADALFDDILEIADDSRNDYVEKLRADGQTDVAFDNEHVQRSRLRVDARKWAASKLNPRKYGDDMRLRHANAEGENLRREYSDEERAVRMASIFVAARKQFPNMDWGQPAGDEE